MNCLRALLRNTALVAVGAGVLLPTTSFSAESTTWAPSPVDWSGSDKRWEATTQQAPNEKAFNTMAGVGAKPSRAEREKMNQAAQATSPAATRAPLTATDRQFLQNAVNDGMKGVHMGELALKQGQSGEVKQLATRIVGDRARVTNQLMGIAVKNGLKPALRSGLAKMSKSDLARFDQAWLGMVVSEQQKDLAAFNRQATLSRDPELKAFVQQAIPTLREHLRLAQAAQKKVTTVATAASATAQARR